MNCKNCGAEIVEGQKFCANCGTRVENSLIHNAVNKAELNETEKINELAPENDVSIENIIQDVETENDNQIEEKKIEKTGATTEKIEKKTNCGYGIASMVLGLVAFFMNTYTIFTLVLAILGLIFSCISFSKFKSGKYKNKGFHIAGLVLSIIVIAVFIVTFFLYMIEYFVLLGLSSSVSSSITGNII